MTLRVAADPARWMYIPARFPWQGYTRVEEWSAALLAALDDLHDYDTDQRELIRAYAEGLSRPSTRASTATPTSPNRTSRRRSRASTSGRTSTSTTPSCRALATCGRCGLR